MRTAFVVAGLLFGSGVHAAQMDINTFNNLRRGMHEAEVLVRAGEPDRVTSPGGHAVRYEGGATHLHAGPRVELHYIPDAREHDPWLTVVVLTNGKVSALERNKVLARPAATPSVLSATDVSAKPPRRDDDIRRERAERTLRAAQRYSELRWRIQERAGQGAEHSRDARPVYSGTDEQGTPYFGDVRPSSGGVRSPG